MSEYRVPHGEKNTQKGGKGQNTKAPTVDGPAVGRAKGNPLSGGFVHRKATGKA